MFEGVWWGGPKNHSSVRHRFYTAELSLQLCLRNERGLADVAMLCICMSASAPVAACCTLGHLV